MADVITPQFPNPFQAGYQPGIPSESQIPSSPMGGVLSLADDTASLHSGVTNHDAAAGTYNFSSSANRALNVFFSEDNGGTYKKIAITGIVGGTPAATTAAEVAALLMANTVFARFILAANNAGTLRLTAKMPSSRFKMYFTGTAAAVLAGVFTTAIAPGSAVTGANQPGKEREFQVTDQEGNPLPGRHLFVTGRVTTVGGAVSATCNFGLNSKGTIVGAAIGGNQDVEMEADEEGKVKFYAADSAAEALVIVVRPGHASSALAVIGQGSGKVTYS